MPPVKEPVTLEEVKAHLRINPGDSSEDQDILQPLIPAAREYCDCHIAIVTTLRAPNTTVVAGHCADAINKVFEQLDQIDPERILKG